MVVRWKRNFQSGHMSLTDEPRAGRSSIKDDLVMVKKVEAVILDGRRPTVERVMAETGLSYGTAWRIIQEELHMNKVSARWVPRLLTPLQKQTRHDFSQHNMTLLEQNEDNFFLLILSLWMSAGRGVILTDYLQKGKTLNSDYYCNLLDKLRDALKQKRHGMISKGVRFLADNAPVHTDQASVATTHCLGYELLQHPPYSSDLVPSDFFLFPEMKKPFRGW
ncbi:hypothetical protein JRQ81_014695 [Phrynocephalus forsythii]|uniref:Transposase n=1 Tax=Phrynocephalus forsythii TaxID=171643 RepID=A0A9Q0XZ76_9SAUR|nr:hypothetical protein JRQ81_014695 [Phrynocephalus forsythii]